MGNYAGNYYRLIILISTSEDMQEVLEALKNGSIKCDDLITGRVALEDVMEEGLKALCVFPLCFGTFH